MRVFMITDTHFGLYLNNLDKWLNMMEDTFDNFIIPLLREEVRPGDILVHCGDLYDNRTSIPINVMNVVERILTDISGILPVHMIVGNHDLYNKGTNEVNSVNLYNHINNISVYTDTHTLNFGGKKLVLMPWVEKRLDMVREINDNPGDYLFCHSDLNGCKMHLNSVAHRNHDKIDVSAFYKYEHVFSGHIHIRQKNKNFTFIGSPYQMDRNDMGDQKGITILDVVKGEIEFIPNKYSPVFRKLTILTTEDIDKLDSEVGSKDYIDLLISNSLLVSDRKVRRKLEIVLSKGGFASIEYLDDIIDEDGEDEEDIVEMLLEGDDGEELEINAKLDYGVYIKEYIKRQTYSSDKLKSTMLREYDAIVEKYEDNYKSVDDSL
jgi:DNA repair exonuclease SbcCD nuclease subunit